MFGRTRRPEGCDLDDLAAEEDMRQAEAPADEATVAEQALDLFGQRVGGDVEVLRFDSQQEVANATANEERLETGVTELVQNA